MDDRSKKVHQSWCTTTDFEFLKFVELCAKGLFEDAMKHFKENGYDVSHFDRALIWASQCGKIGVAKFAIEHGADITTMNNYAMSTAIKFGAFKFVKFLVEQGADVRFDNDFAVRMAAKNGKLDYVKFFVEKGADIHTYNNYALCVAVQFEHLDVIKYLIEKGATMDTYDNSIIEKVCVTGNFEILKLLEKSGVDFLAEHYFSIAAANGHLEIVEYFYEKGADIHRNDDAPICYASFNGQFEVVKFLVQKGANVQAKDNQPIKFADRNGLYEMVKFLIKHGANSSVISDKTKRYISFCRKMETKRKVWAVNTIGSWWIPICYDINRECGRRMMEKSWKRVEEMYEERN